MDDETGTQKNVHIFAMKVVKHIDDFFSLCIAPEGRKERTELYGTKNGCREEKKGTVFATFFGNRMCFYVVFFHLFFDFIC